YFYLMPCAAMFMTAGLALESLRLRDDSQYVYPLAVGLMWAGLTGIATYHAPYAEWLNRVAPWSRGQIAYLFVVNAAVYFVLAILWERAPGPQARMVGKVFRFVIPTHVLLSLLVLGFTAKVQSEERFFLWMLPTAACVFVFASIWRQMK